MKLTIVVPVYISHELHLDFTRQTLESIKTTHNYDVLIINNYCAPEFIKQLSLLANGYTLLANPSGNILASAWNLGIKLAFHRDGAGVREFPRAIMPPEQSEGAREHGNWHSEPSTYTLIINNDIIFHPQCIDNLVTFAQTHPDYYLWTASQWSNLRTLNQAPLTDSWAPHPHFSCFMVNQKTIKTIGYFDEHFTMGYFEDNDYHTRILLKKGVAAATGSAKFYHYGSRTVAVDDNLSADAKYHYQLNRKYFQKKWGLDIHGQAFDPPEKILKHLKPQ